MPPGPGTSTGRTQEHWVTADWTEGSAGGQDATLRLPGHPPTAGYQPGEDPTGYYGRPDQYEQAGGWYEQDSGGYQPGDDLYEHPEGGYADHEGYAPEGGPYYGPDDAYEDNYDAPYGAGEPATPVPPPPGAGGRRRGRGPWPELVIIAAVAVIAAAAILAVTTNNKSGSPGGTTGPSVPATQTSPARVTSTSTAKRTSTSSSVPSVSSTASPSSEIAFDVPGTANWDTGLVSSWLAAEAGEGITAADVNGEAPGKVRFAYTPDTATYWALAAFQPSATLQAEASTAAGQAKLAYFNNSDYAFSWQDGKTWTLLGEVASGDCPGIWVPKSVLAAWGLCGLVPPRTPPSG